MCRMLCFEYDVLSNVYKMLRVEYCVWGDPGIYYVLCIMYYALCIMYYVLCIMYYVWCIEH